jgi:RNA polymerase sigma-70 factor, ECF subfamily
MALSPEDLTVHLPELRALAGRLARSVHEAEDLVQETMLSAVGALGDLREPELAGAWLLRILRRKWYDVLRRKSRERTSPGNAGEPVAPPPEPNDDRLRRAMAALPPEERRLLELRYFESRNSTEIAAILGKSPGSVRSSLFYALRRLEAECRPARLEGEP